jgi:predicted GNAT family acetyltransferase
MGVPPFSVTSHERVDDFISATEAFRANEPVLTNVIGSISEGARDGRAYDSVMWLDVRDAAGTVVGCAVRTSPWNLVVSPMPAGAGIAVGRHVAQVDRQVPGIAGVRSVVDEVVEGLGQADRARVAMVDVVRRLEGFTPPTAPPPGAARQATSSDRDLLLQWMVQFAVDASLPLHDATASVDSRLDAGAFWLWEVDDEPVALAGHAPLVATPAGVIGRIGPVYTPAHLRGRGYGAAVTSAVVTRLLPRTTAIILYADATNPTSNGVYERLGFRVVAEVVEVELTD